MLTSGAYLLRDELDGDLTVLTSCAYLLRDELDGGLTVFMVV